MLAAVEVSPPACALPLAVASVELDKDWSPVVALELLVRAWLPVVALVLLVSDWSPVLVVLSMVRLERPRRSMFGENVDVDPAMVEFESAVDPVTDEFTLELEPEIDGLEVTLVLAEPLVAAGAFAVVLAARFVDEVPAAWPSGMQSMCTGLDERSFALPVSLPASLPACGCPRVLHSGFAALVAAGADFVAAVFCARTGAEPSRAAIAMALR